MLKTKVTRIERFERRERKRMSDHSHDLKLLSSGGPESSSAEGLPNQPDRSVHHRRPRCARMMTIATREGELIPPKEVPHCETCLCLPGKMKCLYRQMSLCDRYAEHHGLKLNLDDHQPAESPNKQQASRSSTNRVRPGRSTAVDKLLREMELGSAVLSDDKLESRGGRQPSVRLDYLVNKPVEMDADSSSRHRSQHRRPSVAGSFYNLARHQSELARMSDREMRISSCERGTTSNGRRRSPAENEDFTHHSGRIVEPTINNIGTDNDVLDLAVNTKVKWMPIDRKNSAALLGAGDLDELDGLRVVDLEELNSNSPEESKVLFEERKKDSLPSEPPTDDLYSSTKEFGSSEAHVRELKLVRLEFIERISEEMRRLQRLQRHLDGCSPRRSVTLTRSVSTMTSARRWNDLVDNATRDY